MAQATVRSAVAVETWTSFVKGALGALGLCLLAVGPFIAVTESFPYLRHYAYALGAVLVLAAATMRLRSILIVLGCLALSAGLVFSLAPDATGDHNLAALLLYGGAGVVLGAAARRPWVALPFLLVPLLVVAPHGGDWSSSRDGFRAAWGDTLDCDCPLAGLPAALALVGASMGSLRKGGLPAVRPSGIPLLLTCLGLVLAGVVLASLMPPALEFSRTVALRMALLAAVLGWVVLAYQVGRVALVWESALACLVLLAGALLVDAGTEFPEALGATLAITVLTSLLPAVLAAAGLLGRKWIGTERPRVQPASEAPTPAAQRSFFAPMPVPEPVLPVQLAPTDLASQRAAAQAAKAAKEPPAPADPAGQPPAPPAAPPPGP